MGIQKFTVNSHSGGDTLFYAHPSFQGHAWYDWALVHFEEQIGSGNTMKVTIRPKSLDSLRLVTNKKPLFSVRKSH